MLQRLYKKTVLGILSGMDKGKLTVTIPDGEQMEIGKDETFTASLHIHSENIWKRIVLYGDIGFAEGYLAEEWDTDDLTGLLKWFIYNLEKVPGVSGSSSNARWMNALQWVNRIWHIRRENSISGSRENIREHYDLSNKFFSLFLDDTMTYSSGLFIEGTEALKDAQLNKYESLCLRAGIKPGDRVLEIGTGWGGFATYAAKNFGANVTTVTISEEQFKHATRLVQEQGLSDKVTILLKDYRLIEGVFDKVVSIEMIEAVGAKYLKAYFQKIHEVLKPDGVLALQAIICPDSRFDQLKRKVDFIQKHIFPGSLLPSVAAINESINATGDMFLFNLKDMGKSYAKTLATWKAAFNAHLPEVQDLGFDNMFIRKWNYYFSYCEAAFDMRNINVVQMIYTRPNNFAYDVKLK